MEKIQEELDRRLDEAPRRRLHVQQKHQEARSQRERRQERARKRRSATLLRASAPKEKTFKRKKKTLYRGIITADADFRAKMEQLEMLMNDRRPDPTAVRYLTSLRRNMPHFLSAREREVGHASERDLFLENQQKAKRLEEEKQRERNEHRRALGPALLQINPSHGEGSKPRAVARKRPRNLAGFFKKSTGGFKRKTERAFNEYYFERFINQPETAHEFPAALVDSSDSDSSDEEVPEHNCKSCNIALVSDMKTGCVTCPGCGVVNTGGFGVGYKQTFSESQASTRSAPPYDRLSHVSIALFLHLLRTLPGTPCCTPSRAPS